MRDWSESFVAAHITFAVAGIANIVTKACPFVSVRSELDISETSVKITEAALGFIGGYSIDLLFTLLDRVVDAFKPAEKSKSNTTLSPTPVIARPLKHTRANLAPHEKKEATPQLVPVTKKEESDSVT